MSNHSTSFFFFSEFFITRWNLGFQKQTRKNLWSSSLIDRQRIFSLRKNLLSKLCQLASFRNCKENYFSLHNIKMLYIIVAEETFIVLNASTYEINPSTKGFSFSWYKIRDGQGNLSHSGILKGSFGNEDKCQFIESFLWLLGTFPISQIKKLSWPCSLIYLQWIKVRLMMHLSITQGCIITQCWTRQWYKLSAECHYNIRKKQKTRTT